MKRILSICCSVVALTFSFNASAQFTVSHDTVTFTPSLALTTIHDDIIVSSTSSISMKWQIDSAASNFPLDWRINSAGGTAFCDNSGCYSDSVDISYPQETTVYPPGPGDFHMQINLAGATTTSGTYYMTVKFFSFPTTAYETFMVSYPTALPIVRNSEETLVYPNPATSSVNVVFDATMDIKNVAIYNIIGKMMCIYKVNGNSANLNTDNLNPGIYFLRLINAQGEVAVTRKFTKQ